MGMPFDSLEEAEKFYVNYAKISGFSVRKSSTKYRNNDGAKELYLRDFVCSKEGFKKSSTIKQTRGHVRLGCKAKISLMKDGERWKVHSLVEGHSHVLCTPRKTHLLRSHREVTNAQKSLIDTFRGANVSTAQTMSILGMDSGGYEEVGCTERDIRNYIGKNRNELKDYDAELFPNHFKEKSEMNPSCYFAYKVDKDNKLTHCFWADGGARKAYGHFGDVVVFDTTYSTNKYSLICAPFTGVNHHFQSINFGCGLLNDEKIDSFMWLFEKWLDAMGNSPPKAFITDQDPAIGAAIAHLFPQVPHRFCIWHIMKKVTEKVSPVSYRSEFLEPFKACVYGSETSDEFEEKWWGIIRKFKLEQNEWLATMFLIREKWIPLYFKDIFMAGMKSSQRSESQNSVFDKYFNKNNSLIEFIHLFERALERQRYNELVADHGTFDKSPELATNYAIESQMAKRYTQKNFTCSKRKLYLLCSVDR
ncbi:Protein FAR-RED IMPAIRED RESPONSE 1 [Acorus gramineus]|uniref:Protein FAR-RED IMPAIRED RESPONSE 1 n=2 Tax=Acorus gramineus TaxID=55184 RepID=A0AAV8ZXU7_ACOGR|nr:Protein FAR-RED IMPAIRED RESPONSE 1 [Acorus gramineus]